MNNLKNINFGAWKYLLIFINTFVILLISLLDFKLLKPGFSYNYIYQKGLVKKDISNSILLSMRADYGYIDKKRNIVIDPKFDVAKDFSEGLAPVEIYKPLY